MNNFFTNQTDVLFTFISTITTVIIIHFLTSKREKRRINEDININKKTDYRNIISKQRIEWLELVRTDFSHLSSHINTIYCLNDSKSQSLQLNAGITFYKFLKDSVESNDLIEFDDKYRDIYIIFSNKIEKALHHLIMLRLRLNPTENQEIIDNLNYIEKSLKETELNESLNEIITETEKLLAAELKKEWEKVKSEI